MSTVLQNIKNKFTKNLVRRIPESFLLNGQTIFNFLSKLIVSLSFILAAYYHVNWLFLSVLGYFFVIIGNTLNNKLDSQKEYERRWHKFLLDFTSDSIGAVLVCIGFMIYIGSPAFLFGLLLLIIYAWKMMISLVQYKMNGKYINDFEILNASNMSLLATLIMIIEIFEPWSIVYSVIFMSALLMVSNIINLKNLFAEANTIDRDRHIYCNSQ